ncbi:MAG TPA: glycosyl hydrolase 108 family protein [Bacteroidales bacterium]|nr:glycosyl hydrolase 108 family protein [Bacteroidales bacterium]
MNYPEVFNKCIKVILKNEGGYGNHPADPGGETKYGIADASDGNKDGMVDIDRDGHGDVPVKDLTVDQAKEIYFKKYWIPMNLDGIRSEELVLQVFDFGVNAGPATSVKLLQRVVGAVVDGKCGPKTCRKANYFEGDVSEAFRKARKQFYFDLIARKPHLDVFIAGWLNRVDHTNLNYA